MQAMDPNILENEILNVHLERHDSSADNSGQVRHGVVGRQVYQEDSGEVVLGPLPNPGEGNQQASSSTPAEGENATRKGTKRRHLSADETQEKKRVKAKENREKTKRKYTSLKNQVRALNSENKDLEQEIGDLLRENADLKSQNENMTMNSTKITPIDDQVVAFLLEKENLRLQLGEQRGQIQPFKEKLPHLYQVIIIPASPVNETLVETVEPLDSSSTSE